MWSLKITFKYFNGTSIVAFFGISLFPSASVYPNNLTLNSKYKKLLLALSASKLVV